MNPGAFFNIFTLAVFFSKQHIFLILFFTSILSSGQGGFKKKYYLPGSTMSMCRDVVEAPNGNLIMIGFTSEVIDGQNCNILTLVGTDSQGNDIWEKKYGGPKFQYLHNHLQVRAAIIKDANCFYHGVAAIDSNGISTSVLLKFNYAGDTLWQRKYWGNAPSLKFHVQDVVKSVDNGLIMTGVFEDATANQLHIAILKTDLNGNELWRKSLLSPNTTYRAWSGVKAVQDSLTQKIIIVGYQYVNFDTQSLVMGTDGLGNKLWHTTFNNPGGGSIGEVIQTQDKNFVTSCGENTNNNLGNLTRYKFNMIKFDINGNMIWKKNYDVISPFGGIAAITERADGDLVMAGSIDTMAVKGFPDVVRIQVYKTDKDGNLKWKRYAGFANSTSTNEFPKSICATQDGGYVIASHFPLGVNPTPYIIIKVDSTGCDTLEAYCKNLITTGFSLYQTLSGLELSVFPNPVNEALHINCAGCNATENFILNISDLSGRMIKDEKIELSNPHIDVKDLSRGVYMVTVSREKEMIYRTKIIKE